MTGDSGFTERAFNAALGLSLFAWTARRVFDRFGSVELAESHAFTPFDGVQLLLAVLTVLVSMLLMVRAPVRREGGLGATAWALPTVVIGAVAFHGVNPDAWGIESVSVLAAGEILTIAAFVSLGKSFAVLPSVRAIVIRGPYRWLRHPAYAGELVMLGACVIAQKSPLLLATWFGAVALIVPRILAEEKLLRESERYVAYTQQVKSRLVPGVW